MKNKIKEFILKNITLKKMSVGIAIAIIILIVMLFTLAVYSNKKSPEDEYFIHLKNSIQESKKTLPELEEKLRFERLKKRCVEAQINRVLDNKDYDLWYCDKIENLEQFSELQKKEANNPVSFLVPKIEVKKQKKEIVKNVATQKTVKHKYWSPGDEKQKWLQYLYEKSWYNKDVVLTFLWENWTFELKRRSGKIWSNWHYDYWLCQLNYQRHKNFINSEDFKNPYKQLDYCLWVYQDWMKKWKIRTTFYAYNVRWKVEKNLEFN